MGQHRQMLGSKVFSQSMSYAENPNSSSQKQKYPQSDLMYNINMVKVTATMDNRITIPSVIHNLISKIEFIYIVMTV
jgi:hypothetical protein